MLGHSTICAVVAAPKARELRTQLEAALARAKTVEIRLDWLADDAEIDLFLKLFSGRAKSRATFPATCIATCRRVEGGGRYKGTIARQLLHLANAIRAGCQWYDIEVETSWQCPPELLDVMLGDGKQLASAHFFESMPGNLSRVAAELKRPIPQRSRSPRIAIRSLKVWSSCDSRAPSAPWWQYPWVKWPCRCGFFLHAKAAR